MKADIIPRCIHCNRRIDPESMTISLVHADGEPLCYPKKYLPGIHSDEQYQLMPKAVL